MARTGACTGCTGCTARACRRTTFIANPQYNWDGTTVGTIYSGSDIGDPLRSQIAPNIEQITLALFQAKVAGSSP